MIFGPAIAAFQTPSLPSGYALLNQVTSVAGVKVVEAMPWRSGFFFLLNGNIADLKQAYGLALKAGEEKWVDHLYIDKVHGEILPGLYAQNRFPVDDALICVSTPGPVSALRAAQAFLADAGQSLHLIDLRAYNESPHLFITGKKASVEDVWKNVAPTLKKTQGLEVELVSNPTLEFLQFFNLSSV